MRKSERTTVPLTAAERAELLALGDSAELRRDMRAAARNTELGFDDYIAFATSVARLANHPRPPSRPVNDSGFKL